MNLTLRTLTLAAATIAVAFSVTGCTGASTDVVGTWGDEQVSQTPSLTFATDGTVSGTDGCNRLMGSFTQEGEEVSLNELASTMMYCEGVDTWLSAAATATVSGDTLTLTDASGTQIGTLKRSS